MGHPQPPLDASLSLTIVWIYLVFLAIGAVAYAVVRWWRHRHAPPPKTTAERSYSQQLSHRMNKRRANAKKKAARMAHEDKKT